MIMSIIMMMMMMMVVAVAKEMMIEMLMSRRSGRNDSGDDPILFARIKERTGGENLGRF